MLSDEGDNLSAVIQITAGAVVLKAVTGLKWRMYLMWAKKRIKIRELNNQLVMLGLKP